MAATDVTYLFFQRDAGVTGSGTDNGPLSPTIKTTRVIQTSHQANVVTGTTRVGLRLRI